MQSTKEHTKEQNDLRWTMIREMVSKAEGHAAPTPEATPATAEKSPGVQVTRATSGSTTFLRRRRV